MQTNVANVACVETSHALMATGKRRPTHLISRSKKVRVWHRRFGHASNARVIRASKLVTGMGELSTTYDPAKIYSDSEASEPEDIDLESRPEPSGPKPNITLKA